MENGKTGTQMTDLSVRDFTEQLAAKVSVPGGGGAAALAGALAVSLGAMAANFTTGKKKYAPYEDELEKLIHESEEIREQLLDLVGQDAACFEPLSKAYSIPKDDPSRPEILEKATREAINPPLNMCRCIVRSIVILERLEKICSVMMISDVGCGANLAEAALKSAALNVFVNTKTLKDRRTADALEKETESLLEEYVPRAGKTAESVRERVLGRA